MKQLMTKWGMELDKNQILQEYPRPQLRRESYVNLNGVWQYEIGDDRGTILVPFSPESKLSGVEKVLQPKQWLIYRRTFVLPEGFRKDRVLLHFGAVDQICKVYVNGRMVGRHVGGYLAFSFDITDALADGENELEVHVQDATEEAPFGRGKQRLNKLKGRLSYLFYTPQSGIWKTVWMESVPNTYIQEVKITPKFDESSVSFEIETSEIKVENRMAAGAEHGMMISIWDGDQLIWEKKGVPEKKITARLESFEPWSPEHPKLYDVVIRWGDDEVRSYFGMRKLSVERDQKGILRFFLNNQPYFFNGVLDQGYWPESLMTPPSDEALLYDIQKLKDCGFNTIRKHIKVESDRFYYHCDRLGMIVWQDMPNGGGSYSMFFVTYLPTVSTWLCRHMPDHCYRLFGRTDERGRRQYRQELKGMLKQLYNHPSIAVWTAFNEGWGQFDAREATKLIRKYGGNRLVNEACGWFDQGGGDMYSIHNYFRKLKVKPQKDRVVALTEYGGYAYEVKDHVACEKKVGYQSYESLEEWMTHYQKLWEEQIYPNVERGLSAAIYTQTSDIEEEVNGLMTYDRAVDKFNLRTMQELNQKLFEKL